MNRSQAQCPPGFITSGKLRAQTGLTVAELKQLEATGRIVPAGTIRGGWRIYPETLSAELRMRAKGYDTRTAAGMSSEIYTSTIAAQVFECLIENMPLTKIVSTKTVHPQVLRLIVQEFEQLAEVLYLTTDQRKSILKTIRLVEPDAAEEIKTAADLVSAIERIAANLLCPVCEKRQRGLCTGCARSSIVKSMKQREERAVNEKENGSSVNIQASTTAAESPVVPDLPDERQSA